MELYESLKRKARTIETKLSTELGVDTLNEIKGYAKYAALLPAVSPELLAAEVGIGAAFFLVQVVGPYLEKQREKRWVEENEERERLREARPRKRINYSMALKEY